MPYEEKSIEKQYYTMSEVAERFDVSNSLIRYWENEIDILEPKKNRKGDRFFTKKDIENLKVIYHLVKERGYTLKGAQKKLKENKQDTIDNVEIVSKLKRVRGFLEELKELLDKPGGSNN
jgi:DNA-binding transcriptional MerR regulator